MLRYAVGITAWILAGAGIAPVATAAPAQIRLALRPEILARGALTADTLVHLETVAASPLALAAVTRTGGLDFDLGADASSNDADAIVKLLRSDRQVLWAQAIESRPASAKALAKAAASESANKLMLRLADGGPGIDAVLPRLAGAAGAPLTIERQIGDVWVIKVGGRYSESALAALATRLETDASVRYVDAVRRARAARVPDNALFSKQWALFDAVGGINAPAAWDLETGNPGMTVAVVDTGLLPHPALAGRLLPGYDFISDSGSANDGTGRDDDPTDSGDAVHENECGPGSPAEDASWHGTFVSGLIAANANTGKGTVGVDWAAKILPVRVLGKCGGTFDDILDGMLWAAGIPVAGVPVNPNPARVINMSLGGAGGCPSAIQEAIDTVLAQGTVVVVAAGNESDDATESSPASCSGVITVAASTRQGDRTFYSNFGRRVDLSAPGGAGESEDWILSTSNDGAVTPGAYDYVYEIGTSFAAPHVAGTVSLMLARNATLTPGRAVAILTATARPFETSTACAQGGHCGAGLLDAGLAVQSTLPASAVTPAGATAVIEYYRADRDHYFMTAAPAEIASLDASSTVFQRTGQVFYAWGTAAAAPAAAKPVCRFYGAPPLIDSHFYTANAAECLYVATHYPGVWTLETPAAFYALVPDTAGNCPNGTLPVYRFFDNRRDANHRHTLDLTVRRAMLNRAWVPEGAGSNGVAFCSPVS